MKRYSRSFNFSLIKLTFSFFWQLQMQVFWGMSESHPICGVQNLYLSFQHILYGKPCMQFLHPHN